jgi:hypothetical protein
VPVLAVIETNPVFALTEHAFETPALYVIAPFPLKVQSVDVELIEIPVI